MSSEQDNQTPNVEAELENRRNSMLSVAHLNVQYETRHGTLNAVSDVSFGIAPGESLGLVGESGCGKSSVALAIAQMPRPSSGEVLLRGTDITQLSGSELRQARRRIPIVFQDPRSSLNPRRKIQESIVQALPDNIRKDRSSRESRIAELLASVGIDRAVRSMYPHQLSGGQCQRISIARAIATNPLVLLCDEPVSSLDVSVQAQILALLAGMREQNDLSMLFISHDLSVIRVMSDRVAVMYLGNICEIAPTNSLFEEPLHPYTRALTQAIPSLYLRDRKRSKPLSGEVPSPVNPPSGCPFRTRCPRAEDVCAVDNPRLTELKDDHWVACHFPLSKPVTIGG